MNLQNRAFILYIIYLNIVYWATFSKCESIVPISKQQQFHVLFKNTKLQINDIKLSNIRAECKCCSKKKKYFENVVNIWTSNTCKINCPGTLLLI